MPAIPLRGLGIAFAVWLILMIAMRVQGAAVAHDWLETRSSRKVVHVGLATFLVLSWLVYPSAPSMRWLAALPAVALATHFALLGTGVVRDTAVVRAGSRSGRAREFSTGPAYYAAAVALLTVVFWRTTPVGVAALTFMSFGDGFAEIVGTRVSSPRLPWSRDKSVAGSLAAFAGGWLGSAAMLWLFAEFGHLPGPWTGYLTPLVWVALAGAVIESLPMREIDNLTVPLGCAALGYLVF